MGNRDLTRDLTRPWPEGPANLQTLYNYVNIHQVLNSYISYMHLCLSLHLTCTCNVCAKLTIMLVVRTLIAFLDILFFVLYTRRFVIVV